MNAVQKLHRKIIQLIKNENDSNLCLALSMGFGVFMGIVPLWGAQLIVALVLAYPLKLNKPVVAIFTNVSIPPAIPFILFASLQIGALLLRGAWLPIMPDGVNWEVCSEYFWCYLAGSLVLATIVGSLVSFVALAILKRYRGENGQKLPISETLSQ